MTDWSAVRASFPAAATCCYLNTAAGGPMSTAAAAAGCSYYEATARDGDVHWDAWLDRVEDVRGSVARLIHAHSNESRSPATPPQLSISRLGNSWERAL